MEKRVMVFLAAVGMLYLLTASAQKLQVHPTQQLAVYDADGKKVGVVTGGDIQFSGFKPLVSMKFEGTPVMLGVLRDGFTGHTLIGWESLDCTGDAFLLADATDPKSSLPIIGVGPPGNTVYVDDGPVRTVSLHSFFKVSSAEPGESIYQCVPQVEPWTREAAPSRALVELTAQFKPPFTVR